MVEALPHGGTHTWTASKPASAAASRSADVKSIGHVTRHSGFKARISWTSRRASSTGRPRTPAATISGTPEATSARRKERFASGVVTTPGRASSDLMVTSRRATFAASRRRRPGPG